MKATSIRLWQDTQGQDLVEYALTAGLVAVAAVAAVPALSLTINNVFSKVGSDRRLGNVTAPVMLQQQARAAIRRPLNS
jgi:pilus assembly protein Flp/PilA